MYLMTSVLVQHKAEHCFSLETLKVKFTSYNSALANFSYVSFLKVAMYVRSHSNHDFI